MSYSLLQPINMKPVFFDENIPRPFFLEISLNQTVNNRLHKIHKLLFHTIRIIVENIVILVFRSPPAIFQFAIPIQIPKLVQIILAILKNHIAHLISKSIQCHGHIVVVLLLHRHEKQLHILRVLIQNVKITIHQIIKILVETPTRNRKPLHNIFHITILVRLRGELILQNLINQISFIFTQIIKSLLWHIITPHIK